MMGRKGSFQFQRNIGGEISGNNYLSLNQTIRAFWITSYSKLSHGNGRTITTRKNTVILFTQKELSWFQSTNETGLSWICSAPSPHEVAKTLIFLIIHKWYVAQNTELRFIDLHCLRIFHPLSPLFVIIVLEQSVLFSTFAHSHMIYYIITSH